MKFSFCFFFLLSILVSNYSHSADETSPWTQDSVRDVFKMMWTSYFKKPKEIVRIMGVCKKWRQWGFQCHHWNYFVKENFRNKGQDTFMALINNPDAQMKTKDVYLLIRDRKYYRSLHMVDELIKFIEHNAFFKAIACPLSHQYNYNKTDLFELDEYEKSKSYDFRLSRCFLRVIAPEEDREELRDDFNRYIPERSLK